MKQNILFWIISLVITVASAYYQRTTGPTYPLSGKAFLRGKDIAYSLERSHAGDGNQRIEIKTDEALIAGVLRWKRFKTNDEWTTIQMRYQNGILSADLPHQPPAGKLQYSIMLESGGNRISIPESGGVVIRFRGDVPAYILIPHILMMFFAMMLSTRTGLEYFCKEPKMKSLAYWTLGTLILGGLILGPIVQKFSFGEYWTGVPFGFDLTDNKTLIAFIGWVIALIQIYRSKNPKRWVLFAAILMLIIFLIPHSVLGSELDYGKLNH